jgi:glycosyltransferase involved in cell wall biosynthesis
MSPRIGLVCSDAPADWGSCGPIRENLRTAYGLLPAPTETVPVSFAKGPSRFDLEYGNGYFLEMARGILERGITKLVFLERHPYAAPLILALKHSSLSRAAKIDYFFHVYGDFTLYPGYWRSLGDELRGLRATFLCASARQRDLVRSVEARARGSAAEYCPFPVDTRHFSFSRGERARWRSRLGIGDRRLLLYSGRLSLQKGIFPHVEEFARRAPSEPNLVLALAGESDDIGSPATGLALPHGFFFQRLEELRKSLPPAVGDRVLWLGHVRREDLPGLYSAADSFASLSLYHDEDFGMAPAEALAAGLPCLLTDWGGYASLAVPGTDVAFAKVRRRGRKLRIDSDSLRCAWEEITCAAPSPRERAEAGRAFANRFSPTAVARTLQRILARKSRAFRGFDDRLGVPAQDRYAEIYGPYAGEVQA